MILREPVEYELSRLRLNKSVLACIFAIECIALKMKSTLQIPLSRFKQKSDEAFYQNKGNFALPTASPFSVHLLLYSISVMAFMLPSPLLGQLCM